MFSDTFELKDKTKTASNSHDSEDIYMYVMFN